jgi:hypothetical protein
MADRLDFEIDDELETGLITGHAGKLDFPQRKA